MVGSYAVVGKQLDHGRCNHHVELLELVFKYMSIKVTAKEDNSRIL